MAAKELRWNFPRKRPVFLRIELLFLLLLTLGIIWITALQEGLSWWQPLGTSGLFLVIYLFVSLLVQKVRTAEASYRVGAQHLHLTKKTKKRTITEKIAFTDIARHKLDKLFLGGYVITRQGKKHPLFFNTRQEVEQFGRLLQLMQKKRKSRRKKG